VLDRKWRKIEEVRAYQREYNKRPKVREANVVCVQAHRRKYPNSIRAQSIVLVEMRAGRMKRPDACECGETRYRLHAHHDDYNEPLKVRFLCPACHSQWHRDNGPGRNRE